MKIAPLLLTLPLLAGAQMTPPPSSSSPAPPIAPQHAHLVESPNGSRADSYFWLRDDDPKIKRPEVMGYLQAENAYTEAVLAPLAGLQQQLLTEMRSRIVDDDSTPPVYDGGWWYWREYRAAAEYPRLMRRRGDRERPDPKGPAQLLLDQPALAAGKPYFKVGGTAVSPDGRTLAWAEDNAGRRIHTLHFKNLQTGERYPEAIPGVLEDLAWANDSRTLFYVLQDPVTLQSGPVYRHRLGSDPKTDAKVYEEADKTLFVGLGRSASRRFVMITVAGTETTETLVIPADRPAAPARVLLARRQNTFNDFVDATDALVEAGWGGADKVFASGGSAGGLLMGAVANQAGSKYRGIVLHVPFVDVLTTMLDETIPLTANEWTQWGDPREKAAYETMLAYSPYDNIRAQDYPAMLVTTGLWDSQVQYYEPAKYVARLRATKTDHNPLLLHVDMAAGHGGASGRYQALTKTAREYAFFLDLAGLAR